MSRYQLKLCVRAANALVGLSGWACLSEHLALAYVIRNRVCLFEML